MKTLLLTAAAALLIAPTAQAQDGLYFGAGIAAIKATSAPETPWGGYDVSGNDAGLALTLGYRFSANGNLSYGIEANLDLTGGKRMDQSCSSIGPAWCDVDSTLRLRGTFSTAVGGGDLTVSLGAVMIKGIAEDGPGFFVDATGRGASLGLAWQGKGGMPLRYDLNVDRIISDDTANYDRSLNVIGLRVSYMF
ncbi:MAG: hypothetical protein J0L76_15370 [Rhodobacterales bacterium]|nr:hypothetical protein [Rhodobacterales bacterium]